MTKLVENIEEVNAYLNPAFMKGLSASSQALGNPSDTTVEGNYNNWIVGGPKSLVDILLIVASDQVETLELKAQRLTDNSIHYDLRKIYGEIGHDLSYYGDKEKKGREHFGFKDGISQPGVRGRICENDYI